jgi:hypothetical protein
MEKFFFLWSRKLPQPANPQKFSITQNPSAHVKDGPLGIIKWTFPMCREKMFPLLHIEMVLKK